MEATPFSSEDDKLSVFECVTALFGSVTRMPVSGCAVALHTPAAWQVDSSKAELASTSTFMHMTPIIGRLRCLGVCAQQVQLVQSAIAGNTPRLAFKLILSTSAEEHSYHVLRLLPAYNGPCGIIFRHVVCQGMVQACLLSMLHSRWSAHPGGQCVHGRHKVRLADPAAWSWATRTLRQSG